MSHEELIRRVVADMRKDAELKELRRLWLKYGAPPPQQETQNEATHIANALY